MMWQIVISFIFYLGFIIYFLLGVYAIALNMNEHLNRVFLFLCLSISIWAFSFAVGNSASSYEEALMWRRISSLGWGVAYSIIVHFTLVLMGAKRALKTKWVYAVLYLPAVTNVIIFCLSSKMAENQYHLVHTAAGWANIPVKNIVDIYFNCYYLLFSLITFILLMSWHQKTRSLIKKKYAKYLMISLSISLLLGISTDALVNRYLEFKIPSLAPIIILIPITTIFYFIHRHGLMQPKRDKRSIAEGVILSDDKRASLFKYIAIVFLIGSILNLLICIFYSVKWSSGFFLSTVMVVGGAVIFVIPSVSKSSKVQENVLMILMAILIPLVLFSNYNQSVRNILWPVPLFLMMVTIIFNSRTMSWIIAGISLLTGIVSWVTSPELVILVGPFDHVLRIAFYGVAIMLTSYINKIYILRLNENEKQMRFQKMISTISTDFVTATSNNLDDKIKALLETCAHYTQADRSYLGLFNEDLQMICFTHEWIRDGVKPVIENLEGLQVDQYSWAKSKMLKNEIIFVPTVNTLPAEAKPEKEMMLSREIKSLLYIPILNKEKVIGFIGFDQVKAQKIWGIEDHDLLKVLANILAEAIAKVEVEKNINQLAYYDRLTGLPNRSLFNNRLEQAINLARRSEKLVGVMFIDLDGFKAVNDTLGHDWGDYLLKQVSDRLSSCIREYDTVARFGGDEYLIMIPEVSHLKDIEEVARRIMGVFEQTIFVNGQEFFITASGGIAVFPVDGEEANVLIKNADLAMYAAKNNGKSQYAVCSLGMKEDVLKKMTLTNNLYRALEKNELELNYQPQVCIKTKEIIGIEALIRWNHPELGRIPPSAFIPIAEQNGLINPIGEWVLQAACRQNKAWQDLGFKPVRMAVNISVEQLRSGNLVHMVKKCLKETGLGPHYLELEITESIAMEESSYMIKALHELKTLGVAIAIDDFGVEYSSLSRLKNLPVDKLKMDMQFIQGIGLNSKDESIISVIIHLARSLGLKVIAEGVETKVQLDFLTREGCNEVQGYYYYRPMLREEIESSIFASPCQVSREHLEI
ncbi:MAG: putative signal transduction protein containing an domain [Clostridia bacterium]|jgi:diguanylate cyclase (GGDEF)-like protein|nr:putative signal transduction protein containing an domain [Clostridia bacterium]